MAIARIARLLAAPALAAGLLVTPSATGLPIAPASVDAVSMPRWTGSIDLYRPGTFSTQKTFLWCTAADVQIARNIVRDAADHSRASQSRYFAWMRARNRYDIPVSDGVDPQGWAAGMRNFVDGRYRLVTFRSYTSALRSAATSLRLTNLPVGVLVSRGGHAWLMTGFTATADPAATRNFVVTSVRVVGPLYGIQSRNGYDMQPNTSLSASAFKRFFTPWHYSGIRMVWEGLYGTVQGAGTNAGPASQAAGSLHAPIPGRARAIPAPRQTPAATPAQPAANQAQPAPVPEPATQPSDRLPIDALAVLVGILAVVAVVFGLHARRRSGAPRQPSKPSTRESDFA